jgi:DNA-directed RNA polymerase specialized sigma subunit
MLNTKQTDLKLWEKYKESGSPADRDALIKHLDPLLRKQVAKWAGNVPQNTLMTQAKLLAAKALDTYNPDRGAALSTHVVNGLAPLSRTVYTYQNVARIPENITLKLNSYNAAKDHLITTLGRDPNTDELHQELGWNANELSRMDKYVRKDLVESVGGLNDNFYGSNASDEDDILASLYFSLTPQEKKIFEYTTGYSGKAILSNSEIMEKLGLSQAQLSYQKALLKDKIEKMRKPGVAWR